MRYFSYLMVVTIGVAALSGCASLRTLFDFALSDEADSEAVAREDTSLSTSTAGSAPERAQKPSKRATSVDNVADVAAAGDLWDRVRQKLALPTVEGNPRVKAEVAWFARNQAYLDRVTHRASRYLYFVMQEIEARGMPMELALLPIIESAYQPFAYSPSGASGLWQFIHATGRRYGLKRDWWHDQRRDVVWSTRAALDYLKDLHAMFDGDWLLAIAAYNSGEGTVIKAIKQAQQNGSRTDFWSLHLPKETRHYVPRFLAIAQVVATPERYGLHLQPIADEPYFAPVEVDRQIDLALVKELAGASMEEIYMLNPAYNRWATSPDGSHLILVPAASEDQFRTNLAATPSERLVSWQRHRIEDGETLSEIADRYQTTIAALQQINALSGSAIRSGRSLVVPISSRPLDEYVLSVAARHLNSPNRRQSTGEKLVYRVRNGDSLWSIARRHNTSVRKLTAWNGINAGGIIRPGQKLTLWLDEEEPAPPAPLTVAAATPTAAAGEAGALRRVSYTVKTGDSLWRISRRFSVSVGALKRWNGLSKSNLLRPGQKLELYVNKSEPVEI